jgi:hypothetical protein
MIADTFTIRKVDGNLIVGTNEANAPIQVVQQLSNTMLNVHLKNGFNYKHECSKTDVISTLLQMFGYQKFLITLEACAWLSECHVHVKSLSGKQLTEAINAFITNLYEYEPNIKSRVVKSKCTCAAKQDRPSYVTYYSWEFEIIANANHLVELEELLLSKEIGIDFLTSALDFGSLTDSQLKDVGRSRHMAPLNLRGNIQSVYYHLKE